LPHPKKDREVQENKKTPFGWRGFGDIGRSWARRPRPCLPIMGTRAMWPMLGFLYENPVCLLDEYREGNVAPAFGQKAFYLQGKQRMPRGKRIGYYRGDSASYQAGLFNQLEEDGVNYGITVVVSRIILGWRRIILSE
jgi:hypothetical protein